YRMTDPKNGRDLWALPLTGAKRDPMVVHSTEFEEREGQFSPDGRWIAFTSNQTGSFEIYAQPFPQGGATWQISTTGGIQPRWRPDGRELFYLALDGRMMATTIAISADGQALQPGATVQLFDTQVAGGTTPGNVKHQYAVSADGQRFLINQTVDEGPPAAITLVINWAGAKPNPSR